MSGGNQGDVRSRGLGYMGVPHSIISTVEGSNNLRRPTRVQIPGPIVTSHLTYSRLLNLSKPLLPHL